MSVFLHLFDVSNKITQCKKKRFYWVNHWRNEMQWQCGIRIRMFLGYHVHERTQCLVNVLNINLLPLVMLHEMYEQQDRPTKQHKQNIQQFYVKVLRNPTSPISEMTEHFIYIFLFCFHVIVKIIGPYTVVIGINGANCR